MVEYCGKKEPSRTYEGIFWLRGNFFLSPNHRLSVSIGGHKVFFFKKKGKSSSTRRERETFDTIVAYNSNTKTT